MGDVAVGVVFLVELQVLGAGVIRPLHRVFESAVGSDGTGGCSLRQAERAQALLLDCFYLLVFRG